MLCKQFVTTPHQEQSQPAAKQGGACFSVSHGGPLELCMSTSAKQESLNTIYRPIQSVPVSSIRQLYEVFAACHDHPSLDVFIRELGRKSGVIMMTRKADGRIVGFSTQTIARLDVDGQSVIGVLSDDVVVLPQYWPQCQSAACRANVGQTALPRCV